VTPNAVIDTLATPLIMERLRAFIVAVHYPTLRRRPMRCAYRAYYSEICHNRRADERSASANSGAGLKPTYTSAGDFHAKDWQWLRTVELCLS